MHDWGGFTLGEQDGMRLRILIQPQREGGYLAECPQLPGAVAHGATWDEALEEMGAQLRETFAGHLSEAIAAARRDLQEPLSPQAVAVEFAFVAGSDDDGNTNYATVA